MAAAAARQLKLGSPTTRSLSMLRKGQTRLGDRENKHRFAIKFAKKIQLATVRLAWNARWTSTMGSFLQKFGSQVFKTFSSMPGSSGLSGRRGSKKPRQGSAQRKYI